MIPPLTRNSSVHRFLKILCLLVGALLLLFSGVDTTLDRLERGAAENTLTWYDLQGNPILVYNGESALVEKLARPARPLVPFSTSVRVAAPYL
jgi:hypothetical protein